MGRGWRGPVPFASASEKTSPALLTLHGSGAVISAFLRFQPVFSGGPRSAAMHFCMVVRRRGPACLLHQLHAANLLQRPVVDHLALGLWNIEVVENLQRLADIERALLG